MTLFQTLSILFSLTALLAYVNRRWIRLPTTIGVMVLTILLSLALIAVDRAILPVASQVRFLLSRVEFDDALLHGMLGALLFAGALHVDLGALKAERVTVGALSTLGVFISANLVGLLFWLGAGALKLPLQFSEALIFGALISPTDPVAVLGILRKVGCKKELETVIVGESLFNDGIGVVVFLLTLKLVEAPAISPMTIIELVGREALGGLCFGLTLGYLGYQMLKSIDDYTVELLISIAVATGGYALAEALHVSAPIAIVVSGLLIGNHGRAFAMSKVTRERLDIFWEMVDETLNALLFVLLGLEVLGLRLGLEIWLSLLAILFVLFARSVSVAIPLVFLRRFRRVNRGALPIFTWGGLRGGISVALALSLPPIRGRETILMATYGVVVFSVIVQGTTIGRLVKRLAR